MQEIILLDLQQEETLLQEQVDLVQLDLEQILEVIVLFQDLVQTARDLTQECHHLEEVVLHQREVLEAVQDHQELQDHHLVEVALVVVDNRTIIFKKKN